MEFNMRLAAIQILEELRVYLTSDCGLNIYMSVNRTTDLTPQPTSTINVQIQISLSTDNPSESTFQYPPGFYNLPFGLPPIAPLLEVATGSQPEGLQHTQNFYDQPADNEEQYLGGSPFDTSPTETEMGPRHANQNPSFDTSPTETEIWPCNANQNPPFDTSPTETEMWPRNANQNPLFDTSPTETEMWPRNANENPIASPIQPLKHASESQLEGLQQAQNLYGQSADNEMQYSRSSPSDMSSRGTEMWLRNLKQNPTAPLIRESNSDFEHETNFESLDRKQLKDTKPLKFAAKSQFGRLHHPQNFCSQPADNEEQYSDCSPCGTSSVGTRNPTASPIRGSNSYFENETSFEYWERKQLTVAKAREIEAAIRDKLKKSNRKTRFKKIIEEIRLASCRRQNAEQSANSDDGDEPHAGSSGTRHESSSDLQYVSSYLQPAMIRDTNLSQEIYPRSVWHPAAPTRLDYHQQAQAGKFSYATVAKTEGHSLQQLFHNDSSSSNSCASCASQVTFSSPTDTNDSSEATSSIGISWSDSSRNESVETHLACLRALRFGNCDEPISPKEARKIEAAPRDQLKKKCSRNAQLKKIIEEIRLASSRRRDSEQSGNGNDGDEPHAGRHESSSDLQYGSSYLRPARVRDSNLSQEIYPRSVWHPAAPTQLDYHQQAQAGEFSYATLAKMQGHSLQQLFHNDSSSSNSCTSCASRVTFSSPTDTNDSSEAPSSIGISWSDSSRNDSVESHVACLRALRLGNCDEPISPKEVNDIQTGPLVDSPPIATDQSMDTNIFQFSDDCPSLQEYYTCPYCNFYKTLSL